MREKPQYVSFDKRKDVAVIQRCQGFFEDTGQLQIF